MNEQKDNLTQQLILGDCFDIFKTIDEKAHLVFVDLPYGQTSCEWDIKINLNDMWEALKPITYDNTLYVFTCTTRFGYNLIHSKPKWFKYDLVWEKSNSVGFLSAKKQPLRNHEMIYVFGKPSRGETGDIRNIPGRTYASLVKAYLTPEDLKNIKKDVGWGYISHFFCGPTSYQFSYPNPKTYQYLVDNCKLDRMDGYLSYDEMIKMKDKKICWTYNPQMTKGKAYKTTGGKTLNGIYGEVMDVPCVNKGERYPKSIIPFKHDKTKIHPTQKPQNLCEWVIKTYSNPGDTVLDFCCGSGSTALACQTTGRGYICIEKSEKYYNIARARLSEGKHQAPE